MIRFATLLSLLTFAPPGFAQAPGHFTPGVSTSVTQAALNDAMAACVLRRNRAAATAFAAAPDDAEALSARARLRGDMVACLAARPSATLSPLYLRSGIAERLLAENGAVLLARAAAMPPAAPVRVASDDRAAQAALACAVRADPADAVAMLRAPAATPDEAAAFRKLAPALEACVPAVGSVSIKPYIVRATVAIETFQAVHGAATTGGLNAGNEMRHHA